jgi:hypothetical protein
MRAKATALLASAAVLASTLVPAGAAEPAQNGGAQCVRWRADAIYRNAGYDHVVTLFNGCSAPAVCTVTTNVNPDPISAQVAPGKEAEVLTFRGSPAREFDARVRCAIEARTGPSHI